jgi:hypothetical protein
MNPRKIFLPTILSLLAALFVLAAKPFHERPIEKFTGTSTCGPITGAPPKVVETGIRFTGQEQICSDDTSDPRLSGTTTISIYGTLNPKANNAGRIWGKIKTINEGGEWEGLWKGKIDKQGRLFVHSKLVGMRGYYGLQAVSMAQRLSPEAAYTLKGYLYKATKPIVVLPK